MIIRLSPAELLTPLRFGNDFREKLYVTGGRYNDVTGGNVVASILPDGSHHAAFKADLDVFAQFVRGIGAEWDKIPLIFRPFHEHTGDWF